MTSATDGICLYDSDLNFIDLNAAALKMTDLPKEKVVGKNLLDISPNIKVVGRYDKYMEVIRTGKPAHFEDVIPKGPIKDNFNVNIKAFKVGDGLGMVLRDITDRRKAEEALRKSEERLKSFMVSATDGFTLFDSELNFIDVNEAALKMAGITREEIIGKNLAEIAPQSKTSGRYDQYMNVIKTGKPLFIEEATPATHSGKKIYVNISGFRVGEGLGLITTDVTERKIAEDAMKTEKERLYSALDSMTSLVVIEDENYNIIYENQRLQKVYGKGVGEKCYKQYIGREVPCEICPITEILHGDKKELRYYPQSAGRIYESLASEFKMPDGSRAVIETHQDVTERKIAEDALKESEEKYRTLLEHLPQRVFYKNLKSEYVSCNENYAKDLGIKIEDVVGKTDYDFYPKKLADKFRADDKRIMESGIESEDIEENIILDGRQFLVQTVKTPVIDNGEVVGILGVYWDISQRKKVEEEREHLIKELEEKNTELERFTYTVSHDLKSPLITINGFLGLLEQNVVNHRFDLMKGDMGHIKGATAKMLQLLDELLELSRLGRVISPPEDIDMVELVTEVMELNIGRLSKKNVRIDISKDLPTVYGDKARIREVIQNLVENSVKYMGDQKEPRVEVGVKKGYGQKVMYVKDNGMGIEPRYQKNIFNIFEKLDPNIEGSGIGLTIVKRIVELHGGHIWVKSRGPGEGSAFCFTLPTK